MRWIANDEDAQRLNRQVVVSFLTEPGNADLQVRLSVQSEGSSRAVLQHAGQVAFRRQAARAMLDHLLVLVCRVHLTQTVIITINSKKRKSKKIFEGVQKVSFLPNK